MGSKVRVTVQTLQILRVLLADPLADRYGLEISRESGLPTGSIYPILARLETAGWITGAWEQIDESAAGRRRRRYYRLSEDGAQRAREAVVAMVADLAPVTTPRHSPHPGQALPGQALT